MAPGKAGSRIPIQRIGLRIADDRWLFLGNDGDWGIRFNSASQRVEVRGNSVFDELSSRRTPKASCIVATTANIDLSSAPATIDTIALSLETPRQRVLVKNQTAGAENGIYDWNGAAVAMTRTHDSNEATELEGSEVKVRQGTQGDRNFQVVTDNIVLDTTSIVWTEVTSTAPSAHAASHTNGTDDIQDATASQKGVATAAQITKLDVLDDANIPTRVDTFGSAFTSPSVAAAGGIQSFNLTGFGKLGTNIQRLQITPSTDIDDYTVELFREDTHTTLQYRLLNVTDSAAAAVATLDEVIGLMWDDDAAGSELHMRITNDDPANAATFDIEAEGVTLPR